MPGAIQVTVFEFSGVPSTSPKSLKVSMGKREFQTWDKGEFSFSIAKLSEDLVVALLDAAGNEIAHSDIRTMHVIEKGTWDEVFSISGCGDVHMKLQFVLNEEDRTRIRIVRESVVKKKLETNPNINVRLTETSDNSVRSLKEAEQVSDAGKGSVSINVAIPKVEALQSGSDSDSATKQKEEGTNLEAVIPDTTDGGRGAPLPPGNEGVEPETEPAHERLPDNEIADVRSIAEEGNLARLTESEAPDTVASKLRDDPKQESRRIKVPSNVRKMINAFESSQIQDTGKTDSNLEVKSLKKTPSVPSQFNGSRKEGQVVSPADDQTRQYEGSVSSGTDPPQVTTATPVLLEGKFSKKPVLKKVQKLPANLVEESLEAATSSGRVVAEGPQLAQVHKEASNSRTKSLECYEEKCASAQSSGAWIFPDDTRRMCITTAGEHVVNIAGKHWYEASTCQGMNVSSESEHKMEKNTEETADPEKSRRGRSPGDLYNGLAGKVIKLAAIFGFGLLVLLTRQKEPRKKKNTEEFDVLFSVPSYIDEKSLIP